MKTFAKLFEYDDIGQVVLMADTVDDDDDEPALIFYFRPSLPCLGVCNIAIAFGDSDTAEESRDKALASFDKEQVHSVISKALENMNGFFSTGE